MTFFSYGEKISLSNINQIGVICYLFVCTYLKSQIVCNKIVNITQENLKNEVE